jgi:class I fructose-bisphosphate aldolase
MSERLSTIKTILGDDAKSLLDHVCKTIPKEQLHIPGPNFVDEIFSISDRSKTLFRPKDVEGVSENSSPLRTLHRIL